MAEVDLHLHTTESDGRLTPADLVKLVAKRGLKTVAVTDHDVTTGLELAWEAAAEYPWLNIIPGIELSTDIPGGEIHILGYHINYKDTYLQSRLERFQASRIGRAQEMVRLLATLGMHLEWERVKEIAGPGSIGRPHIAQAMVEKGYVSLPREAFDKYLGRNGPAYAEREKQTPEEAVQLILRVGGIPVLAHPTHVDDLELALSTLKDAGLEGMEVYYAEYDQDTIERLARIAQRHNLLPCGGSDYHALGIPGEHLPGEMGPPMEVVRLLNDLAMARTDG